MTLQRQLMQFATVVALLSASAAQAQDKLNILVIWGDTRLAQEFRIQQ